jgi:hypothetical protein
MAQVLCISHPSIDEYIDQLLLDVTHLQCIHIASE